MINVRDSRLTKADRKILEFLQGGPKPFYRIKRGLNYSTRFLRLHLDRLYALRYVGRFVGDDNLVYYRLRREKVG
ncbi:MAG: hypothetical protein ACTSP1_08210 [Candidatus Freyarchaeota archaeon]